MVKSNNYKWLKPKKSHLPEFFKLEPAYLEKEVVDRAKVAPYKVELKVVNILGSGICPYGHEIGDTFIFEGDTVKTVKSHTWGHNLCAVPLSWFQYDIARYMWGAYLPEARGDEENKTGLLICNDIKSWVVFQIRRIKNPESPYWKKGE
jgi:uncharacterized repeat protein (TIGR04076 family)